MKKSLIFGVLALTIVGLLSFAGGRASNSVASKSSNNKTEVHIIVTKIPIMVLIK